MNNYEKILAEKEQEILKLKAENDALKEKAILFPGTEEVILNLKDMIAIFPGNIFWRDINGKLLGVNNNLAKFCGFATAQEMIRTDITELMSEDEAGLLTEVDQKVLKTGEEFIGTEMGIDHKNQAHYFVSHKRAVRNKLGDIVGLLGISLDITERKKMESDLQIAKEKAEESSRAKSKFLAVINHELRTPLACIINLLTFLKCEKLSDGSNVLIRTMENCTQYLLNLVNDVLDFSKLETGKHHLNICDIELDQLFLEIFSMLEGLAINKGLKLELVCSNSLPKVIWSDPQVIRQILINLITNAIKFTESGSVILKVDHLGSENDRAKLAFSIIDTGIGIPENKLNVIFEPFQQLEDAYMRQSSRSGTGLGLAIVERLVSLLDAEISATSKVGVGSTFSVVGSFKIDGKITPRAKSVEAKFTHKASVERIKERDKIPHILLIEDDPIIQFVHSKMLTDLGCKVDIAKTGKEALDSLSGHDLVFADISLPDMSGFEVIKNIRARTTKERDVPIVALTVYTDKQEKTASFKAGANHFSNKPISSEQLEKIILKFLP